MPFIYVRSFSKEIKIIQKNTFKIIQNYSRGYAKKKLFTNHISNRKLLVQKPEDGSYRERVYSFTSNNTGSAMVEAVIVIPLILSVCVMLMQFIVMVNVENNIQEKFTDVSNGIMVDAYAYDRKGYLYTMTDALLVAKLNSRNFKKFINNSNVRNGISGMSYLKSNTIYDEEKSILIKSNYKIKINSFFWGRKNLKQSQVVCFRPLIGKSIMPANNTTNEKVVYITQTGTVYHTSRECTHLLLSVSTKKLSEVSSLRNSSGGKYYACELCIKSDVAASEKVYIAKTGNRYHKDKGCSGLKRTVKEILYSEIGDRKLCTRCAS